MTHAVRNKNKYTYIKLVKSLAPHGKAKKKRIVRDRTSSEYITDNHILALKNQC